MSSFPMVMDQALMGSGVPNPEPSPGVYNFGGIDRNIHLIESTGGTPVITLMAAPDWMKGGAPGTTNWANINVAPLPAHYQDFANLCATVAARYPSVKYFIVWRQLQGFFSQTTGTYDIASYVKLYNDVYTAIKAVRPDALIGGPYSSVLTYSGPRGDLTPRPHGKWGWSDTGSLNAISYFLHNAVGADFLALSGPTYTKDKGMLTDPVTQAGKYAAILRWVKQRTKLPVWWIEGPVGVSTPGQRAVAARIAALVELAMSGDSVGMQWQPQQDSGFPGEGLWTNVIAPGGGQPTELAQLMPSVLRVLAQPVTQVVPEPVGVVAVTGPGGTIAVNGTPKSRVAKIGSVTVPLGPDAVSISDSPGAPVMGNVTAGDTQAVVNFSPPIATGVSPVTDYTATATDLTNPVNGGQTANGAASPLTVTGLTDGDSYTFSVTATNSAGTSVSSAASAVVVPSVPQPFVSSVSPGQLPQGSFNVAAVFTGGNFVSTTTVRVLGSGITLSSVAVVNSTTIDATFAVATDAPTGARDVNVSTVFGPATCTGCFTVAPAPSLISASPSSQQGGTTATVTFNGAGFEPGATIKFTGPSSEVTADASSIAITPDTLTASVRVPGGTPVGAYTVKIINPDQSSASCSTCFSVT
jgi:Fibronectin type III domain